MSQETTSLKRNGHVIFFTQEKKGAEQVKAEDRAAQKRDHEFQKMEKLLSMVRQVYKEKK